MISQEPSPKNHAARISCRLTKLDAAMLPIIQLMARKRRRSRFQCGLRMIWETTGTELSRNLRPPGTAEMRERTSDLVDRCKPPRKPQRCPASVLDPDTSGVCKIIAKPLSKSQIREAGVSPSLWRAEKRTTVQSGSIGRTVNYRSFIRRRGGGRIINWI